MTSKLRSLSSLLARCMAPDVSNAVKFKVKIMEFDPNLNMHFAKHETVYACDPTNSCKPGDLALIEKLPNKVTKYITHKVSRVVYPLGDITDPVTGKKVVAGKYRDEIEATSQLYGANPERFNYETAPERGWQKEKRDFSYQETYRKYHMFEKDDPYAV